MAILGWRLRNWVSDVDFIGKISCTSLPISSAADDYPLMTDVIHKLFPGMVLTELSKKGAHINELLILGDGRIVAVGSSNLQVAVALYTPEGLLDQSFSGDGALVLDFGGLYSVGVSVHALSDGGLLVTGREYIRDQPNMNGRDYLVAAQLTADGSLNADFSGDGKLSLDDGRSDTSIGSVVASPDGGLVVAGDTYSVQTQLGQMELSRVTPDFRFDASFGSAGRQRVDVTGARLTYARDVALQSDGKIVAVGDDDSSDRIKFTIVRRNADGTPDTGFSDDGLAQVAFGEGYYGGQAYSVAIQPDGKIVVAGVGQVPKNSNDPNDPIAPNATDDFAVCRLNPDGSLDTSFSRDGKQTTDFGGNRDRAYCVAIQPDGKILVGGISKVVANENMAIARYLPNGLLDTSFSGDGMLTIDFQGSADSISAISVLDDGKILLAGSAAQLGSSPDFALVRLNSDGSLDESFGAGPGANRPPILTSGGGREDTSAVVFENTVFVTTVAARDDDGDSLSFSITGGADRALFLVDAVSGRLSFAQAPDYEAPGDANKDNRYELVVSVSDDKGGTDEQSWLVHIQNAFEAVIRGTEGPDVLIGTSANDVLDGLGGRDRLQGGAGDDGIWGGADIDTVEYTGPRALYEVSADVSGISVSSARDGTDSLAQVERIAFSDVSLAFDIDGAAGTVARYLGVVFGKEAVADAALVGIGLDLLDGGTSSTQLMQLALDSALGSGYEPAAEVDLLYRNLLGRSPDAAEESYWTDVLLRGDYDGVSLAQMAAQLELNAINIGLAGLRETGLSYLDV